jgi:hypothetical protein
MPWMQSYFQIYNMSNISCVCSCIISYPSSSAYLSTSIYTTVHSVRRVKCQEPNHILVVDHIEGTIVINLVEEEDMVNVKVVKDTINESHIMTTRLMKRTLLLR